MSIKDKLPVSYLLFTYWGRIDRLTYWTVSVFIWTTFYALFEILSLTISYSATLVLYPPLFWVLWATAVKRLHDSGKSSLWLFLTLVPVLGPMVLLFLLGFRRGNIETNRFGPRPGAAPDYYRNTDVASLPDPVTGGKVVNDITQINPVIVAGVEKPDTVEQLQRILRESTGPVSIGGGRFSMGGQTASPGTLHIDMRCLNKVLDFSPERKTIKVQAGIRWCDIQHYIDKYDLSVKIMQTYANFTVGGSLSVNCHGRYMNQGPVILSVRSLEVMMADGTLIQTSPTEHPEIFFACVGCYNAIAVIVTAELELEDNVRVLRVQHKMRLADYNSWFKEHIRHNPEVIFHNADIYPPAYRNLRGVSWLRTDKKPNVKTRLMPLAAAYPVERYFITAFSRSSFGKWRREYIIDPIVYAGKRIHWRNYEAGYDVLELEPESRRDATYVLQEYFVGVELFDQFAEAMSGIFKKHGVNVINVSIRHAKADTGSLLAWAREEVFAFVIWYRQGTRPEEKARVGVWTRELIDAALSLGGSYYLPYQQHATAEQLHKAHPRMKELFELKRKFDPDFRFRNIIWDTYYKPTDDAI